MRFLYCDNCKAQTQHIIFCSQVQCQQCGQGNKKSSQNLKKQNNYPTRQTVQTESGEELSKDETCSASSTEAKTGDLNSRGRKR